MLQELHLLILHSLIYFIFHPQNWDGPLERNMQMYAKQDEQASSEHPALEALWLSRARGEWGGRQVEEDPLLLSRE